MLKFGVSGILQSEVELSLVDLQQLTVSFWFFRGEEFITVFFRAAHASDTDRGWVITNATGTWRARWGRDGVATQHTSDVTSTLNALEHWCITWNGGYAASDTIFYKNGVATGTTSFVAGSGTQVTGTPEAYFIDLNGVPESQEGGHFAIWGRVLYPSEVMRLARQDSPLSFPHRLKSYNVF